MKIFNGNFQRRTKSYKFWLNICFANLILREKVPPYYRILDYDSNFFFAFDKKNEFEFRLGGTEHNYTIQCNRNFHLKLLRLLFNLLVSKELKPISEEKQNHLFSFEKIIFEWNFRWMKCIFDCYIDSHWQLLIYFIMECCRLLLHGMWSHFCMLVFLINWWEKHRRSVSVCACSLNI